MRKVLLVLLGVALVMGLLFYARNADRNTGLPPQETEVIFTPAPAVTPELEEVPEGVPVRNTQYGYVKGVVQDGVEVFYGIPYGGDTDGEARWKAPTAPERWTHIRDCTIRGSISLQQVSVFYEGGVISPDVAGSTDCLNLDVYVPAGADKLPVLVYIHSGNNQGGSSHGEIAGNELAIRDDCVFVSVNYRTGLLGFNALPSLVRSRNSGNFGLLDIAAALRWVRDNIEEFGGDARNVTVSGFASGGRNVMAMLISSTFDGLFDRAIVFSGGMTICNQEDAAWKDAALIAPLAVEDGIAKTEEEAARWLVKDTDEVREYLYGLNAARLAGITLKNDLRMSSFPQLFGDNVVLPANGFNSKRFVNDVPILMVTGTTEFSQYGISDSYLASIENEYIRSNAITFTVDRGSEWYRLFNTQRSAEKMIESYRSPIYLCQVNYGGKNSDTAIPTYGSFQGVYLPMLSSSHNYGTIADFTGADYQAMAEIFNACLRNFLRTGNPNGDGLEMEWTAWDADTQLTLVMDASKRTGLTKIVVSNVNRTNAQLFNELNYDYAVDFNTRSALISNVLNGRWFSDEIDSHYDNPSLW